MFSSNRRKLVRKSAVLVAIGCSCRRPKLSDVHSPKPLLKTPENRIPADINHRSSSSSWEGSRGISTTDGNSTTTSTTFFSVNDNDDASPASVKNTKPVMGFRRIGESVAVVKDSDDPFLDFQQSILQMILEKQIYAKDDLCELLECLLSLNPPSNHEIIVRAFTEIWNAVFSAPKFRFREF